ncbi:hypothetical protein NP493_587g04014 [Ridgeia piscesae]|uniref:BOS complex subunit NCLN n=1 Tax=Ridgeia piscesae TaxID=27915 RepID=A0AAD9KVJ2_RIDPI|nr:hypothetical protein NP493_587g04014 [Ridgeia piscesae]
MWLCGADEVVEMFKSSFPLSFLFFVPVLILISPVSPAAAAHEFAVFRMQQYDLQGSSYGCRNSLVNVEARAIEAQMYTRRCVITKLQDLAMDKYREIVSQNAGALLVLLPQNLTELPNIVKEHLLELEQDLMQEETPLPVYFATETPQLLDIYADVKTSMNSDQAGSAAEALLHAASANGFQMVVAGAQSKALGDFQLVNIQGKLTGSGIEEQLPTVAIVAHYDAYGVAPMLAKGADSNGSGVVALLELARLFSKLYTNSRTHAKFNLLFLLSAGGKLNYMGTKRWIEDQLDSSESSLLTDVSYVMCLDSLGAGENLYLHVSKPPRDGVAGDVLLGNLREVMGQFYPDAKFEMVHKKINLADEYLSWEHERFSIRRLPAFTLSHHSTHKAPLRKSVLDVRDSVDKNVLSRNVKIIAESLARHIFNLSHDTDFEVFADSLKVEPQTIGSWLDYISSQPRPAQSLGKTSPLVATLQQALAKLLKDVQLHMVKADKRDPEFVFYSGLEYVMNAYNVKPAVFDLFLALGIAAYLGIIYFLVQVGTTCH